MRLPVLLMLAPALVGAAPVDTGLWGVRLGVGPEEARAAFAPEGATVKAEWTVEREGPVERHAFRCRPEARCYAVPWSADLHFVGGLLAAVTLRADSDHAPEGQPLVPLLLRVEGRAGLGAPAARAQAAGRQVRYFLRDRHTVVWVRDGPAVEVKLYLDALAPVGRAEAVAAGAPDGGVLKTLPGAAAYRAGHEAIARADWDAAVRSLDRARAARGASVLLRREADLVLAMALAARARHTAADAPRRAAADLARARRLAPALAPHLDDLARQLGLPSRRPSPQPARS